MDTPKANARMFTLSIYMGEEFEGYKVVPWAVARDLEIALSQAEARVAAMEKDAEKFALTPPASETVNAARYLYLRNNCDTNPHGPIVCCGMGDDFEFLRYEELDREVDAAIAALAE